MDFLGSVNNLMTTFRYNSASSCMEILKVLFQLFHHGSPIRNFTSNGFRKIAPLGTLECTQ